MTRSQRAAGTATRPSGKTSAACIGSPTTTTRSGAQQPASNTRHSRALRIRHPGIIQRALQVGQLDRERRVVAVPQRSRPTLIRGL